MYYKNIIKFVFVSVLGCSIAAFTIIGARAADQDIETIKLTDVRGMRYCEFLLIHKDRVVIYNTSASPAGCPAEIWDTLNVEELAKAHGAVKAQLNGPKFWASDELTLGFGETRDFGGIEARYAATLPISAVGSGEGSDPYVTFTTKKSQVLVYYKGNPVYELIDPDGNVFVLNAYGSKVKDGDPANLVDQLTPHDGWTFRVRVPDEQLVKTHKGDTPSKMVGDDFHQYYSMED